MLKRAMTSTAASYKKRTGHVNEQHFAYLIDGDVVGGRTDKTDVIDQAYNTYSVKGGEWWQIFLYGRDRFVNLRAGDPILQVWEECPLLYCVEKI